MTLDDAEIARAFGRPLKPAVADLIEVAAAVHLVDRLQRRPSPYRAGGSWHRELELEIGVRDPNRWTDPQVTGALHELLGWLTDDTWNIQFTDRTTGARTGEVVQFLFDTPPNGSVVALYSGGLDSLAGIALDVVNGERPVLVSAVANSRQASGQSRTAEIVSGQLGVSLPRVAVRFHLHGARALEESHRSRGFGFLALGAAVATMAELSVVRVYENGPGAINLPYTRAQSGAQATRSMHPETLRRMASLTSLALQHPITIENPNQYRTKAEMCRDLPRQALGAVPTALSCDMSFAHRATRTPSCGQCTSCLLRRQALWTAELRDIERQTAHRVDLFGNAHETADRYSLNAMLTQAARLWRATRATDPWAALISEFPELSVAEGALASSNAPSTQPTRDRLADLYRRYSGEWASLPLAGVSWYFPTPLRSSCIGATTSWPAKH